jgi:4-hydroxy-3-methylbut-2-enyl diphosphate reductase
MSEGWLPDQRPITVVLTCGASCPDAILDDVLRRLLSMVPDARPVEFVLELYPEVEAP